MKATDEIYRQLNERLSNRELWEKYDKDMVRNIVRSGGEMTFLGYTLDLNKVNFPGKLS